MKLEFLPGTPADLVAVQGSVSSPPRAPDFVPQWAARRLLLMRGGVSRLLRNLPHWQTISCC